MMKNYTPAMRRGAAADLDAKLGAPPRLVFFGSCICEVVVTEYDDGTSLEWATRRPHACPGPRKEPIPLPLAAPQRAPLAGEADPFTRVAQQVAKPARSVIDL